MNLTTRVLEFVRAHPGCSSSDVHQKLGSSARTLISTLATRMPQRLRRAKERGPDGLPRWRYWPIDAEAKKAPPRSFFTHALMKAIMGDR